MGPVHYNYTAYRSIHEARCIAHGSWLNHPGHCRKALDWLVIIKENEMINEYRKELAYAQSAYDSLHTYYKAYNEKLNAKRKCEVENTIVLLQSIINILHTDIAMAHNEVYEVRRYISV